MNYIVKAKAKTEERIIDGNNLLRRSLMEYNKLLDFTKEMKDAFFDLYFKIKLNDTERNIPISDELLLKFRGLENLSKKSFVKEVSEVGESELLTETLHDKRRNY